MKFVVGFFNNKKSLSWYVSTKLKKKKSCVKSGPSGSPVNREKKRNWCHDTIRTYNISCVSFIEIIGQVAVSYAY